MAPPSSSRSADQPYDRSRPTWAGPVGSIHMEQPQNTMNTSTGAPIVNLTFNTPTSSSRQDSEAIVESVATARADHEVYYHQLLTKKRGSPLWIPGPGMQLPVEYRRQGISIGDVGIITPIGSFDFLFNIFLPATHPINWNVPQTFSQLAREQLECEVDKRCDYGPNSYLTSSSVRTTAVRTTGRGWFAAAPPANQVFENSSGEAAILTMPDGASTKDLLNTLQIRQCISENAQNWYEYVTQRRGRTVKNGDIRVVVGIDKVKSWGIATATCNAGQTASLAYRRLDSTRYCWDCTGGSGRVGPVELEINDLVENNIIPQNQSVFVRTMNFTLSGEIGYDFPSQAVVHPVGPVPGQGGSAADRGRTEGGHSTSGEAGSSSSHQTSSMQGTSHSITSVIIDSIQHGIGYHPSAALHTYLHEKFPNANMVITQDSDWISVLNDDDTAFPEPMELIDRISKTFDVIERDGIVVIGTTPLQVTNRKPCPLPVASFIGRNEILEKMCRYFDSDRNFRHVFVLYGLGGSGKSQLAFKFLQESQANKRFVNIFYIDATNQQTLEMDLGAITPGNVDRSVEASLGWLANQSDGDWILFFDNADDVHLRLNQFFPPCAHGNILVTTRNRELHHYNVEREAQSVPGMDHEDATNLLLHLSQAQDTDENRALAAEIVQELHHFTLAVSQAGAFIRCHSSLRRYRELLQRGRDDLLQHDDSAVQGHDPYGLTVSATWSLSYDKLNTSARSFLQICSILHHEGISEEMFQRAALSQFQLEDSELQNEVTELLNLFGKRDSCWSSVIFLGVVKSLGSYSLVEYDHRNRTYSLHPLFHHWISTTMGKNRHVMRKYAVCIVGLSISWTNVEDYQYRRALLKHIESSTASLNPTEVDPVVASHLALTYCEQGRWRDAEELEVVVMKKRKQVLGDDHPDTLVSMSNLANTYRKQGRWRDAEELQVVVMEKRKRLLGNDHPYTLSSIANLAVTYRDQGRWTDAKELELIEMKKTKQLLGDDHPTLTTMFKQVRDVSIFGEIHSPKVRSGLDKLLEHVNVEAFHNAVTSHDLPQCYPGTREAVKKDLVKWVENVKRQHPIYYLHAPAGSGKTAIAKMLADHFDNPPDRLLASFFFSRTVQGRNNARQLITTIAFQMAINIPSTAPFIARAVLQDPFISRKDLLSQLTSLIIQPLGDACQAAQDGQPTRWPQLVIIDGLDKCIGQPKDAAQVEVLQIIAQLARYSQLFPFAILLSCRPETHIKREFQTRPLAAMSVKVSLSNKYDSDQDIRHFLSSEFREIRSAQSHVVKLASDWPGEEVIDFLVKKSSGCFIYPADVIKYIRISNKNPIHGLKVVLGLAKQSNDEKPFAQLDALYLHKLDSIESEHCSTAMDVFAFTLAVSDANRVQRLSMSKSTFNPIPNLRNDDWKYSLLSLEDILIKFTNGDGLVEFLHDSLGDFLLDPNRSGKYHIDLGKAHATIVNHTLDYIKGGSKEPPSQSIMYLHRHLPLSAPTKALQNSLRSLLEPSTATKLIESFIQFPTRCHWESVTDLANILGQSPFKDASKMKTDFLRLVKHYVSRQIPNYTPSPLNYLITLFLSPALVNDYLTLFRNSNTTRGGQPADPILWSALNLLNETAQQVDGGSLNLFRLLNERGPTTGVAKTVRDFIHESGYTLTPETCAKICTKLLKVRFDKRETITSRDLVLVLNLFRLIIVPLLKNASPSQELCKQLKVAKDRVYAACDPSIGWMKEDVTRTWLEVDAYVIQISAIAHSVPRGSKK